MTSGCNTAPEHKMNLMLLKSCRLSVAVFSIANAIDGTILKVFALQAEDSRRSSSRLYFFNSMLYDPSQMPINPTALKPESVSDV
jgi:hypothetical protein